VGKDMASTEKGLVDDISVTSAVSVPNIKDTQTNVSEGYIRSWSPTFRKHHIEELPIDTEIYCFEDMEAVVEHLVHLEKSLSHGGRKRTVRTGNYC
jgi:hypothetical protein